MFKKSEKIVTYLLVNLDAEVSTVEMAKKFSSIPEVVEATVVYGTYDLILRIETESSLEIKEVTLKSIRTLDHVQKTMTMISLESWTRTS